MTSKELSFRFCHHYSFFHHLINLSCLMIPQLCATAIDAPSLTAKAIVFIVLTSSRTRMSRGDNCAQTLCRYTCSTYRSQSSLSGPLFQLHTGQSFLKASSSSPPDSKPAHIESLCLVCCAEFSYTPWALQLALFKTYYASGSYAAVACLCFELYCHDYSRLSY